MGKIMRVRQRTDSGAVCEIKIWSCRPRGLSIDKVKPPKPRFKTEEDKQMHSLLISRRQFARLINANCSPSSLYSTLTFDMENEVHTFDEARKLRELFIRRLLHKFPDAVIFLVMGRGKHTNRIHFHMVSNGVPEAFIEKQWKYGSVVRIEHLREHNWYDGKDHGQDYTGLANYMFDHWTKEQGGHRWRMTRTAKQPDVEKPEEIKREYSENKPPKPPKGYMLVDCQGNRYGYLYFKYVKEPPSAMRRRSKKTAEERFD